MARKKQGPRRDIPYSQRMAMERWETIRDEREDAAITSLRLACVALNDTEGLGYKRICKFAVRCTQLHKEYYADRELGELHLNRRLAAIGFDTSGGGMRASFDENGNPVKVEAKK